MVCSWTFSEDSQVAAVDVESDRIRPLLLKNTRCQLTFMTVVRLTAAAIAADSSSTFQRIKSSGGRGAGSALAAFLASQPAVILARPWTE
jgi:hypothetical protein